MTWRATAATTVGSVHVREGRPLQDAVATGHADGVAVVAVADGHGHRLHFRSDVGSRLAADVAVAAVRAAAAGWEGRPAAAVADLLPDLGRGIHDTWAAAVRDHVAAHPFLPGEEVADPLVPYGSTLVVLAVAAGVLVVLQVGDGDAVAVRSDGEAFRPLPDDPRLDGVRTTSLCQPDVLDALRSTAVPLAEDDVVLAFACTDGFGGPRADRTGWWRRTGAELLDVARTEGLDRVAERLPGWLEEPALVGGDDVSLGLVTDAG